MEKKALTVQKRLKAVADIIDILKEAPDEEVMSLLGMVITMMRKGKELDIPNLLKTKAH